MDATEMIEMAEASEVRSLESVGYRSLVDNKINRNNIARSEVCTVNKANRTRLTRLLNAGWVLDRMETDFHRSPHPYTSAYLVLMK